MDAETAVVSDDTRRPGRPKGAVNKTTREIRAVAQRHGRAAIRGLVKLAREAEREDTRLKAWIELLDRGYGRPVTPVETSGPDGGPQEIDVSTLTPAERAQRLAAILRERQAAVKQEIEESFLEPSPAGRHGEGLKIIAGRAVSGLPDNNTNDDGETT